MSFYAMINKDLTKAQIDAAGLDPGSIYVASDDKDYYVFVNDDGTPKPVSTVSDAGTKVESEPVEIAAASIVTETVTVNLNNYNPPGFDTAIVVMVTNNSGILNLTGMVSAGDYRKFTFYNAGPDDIRSKHLSTSSTVGNRIFNRGGSLNYTISEGESVDFLYDTANSRWIMI